MINALLMLAAAGFGFGGSPWIGFAICAPIAIVFSFPQHLDVLASYYGQPKTDIAFMILMYFCLVSLGAFASAWVGYFRPGRCSTCESYHFASVEVWPDHVRLSRRPYL